MLERLQIRWATCQARRVQPELGELFRPSELVCSERLLLCKHCCKRREVVLLNVGMGQEQKFGVGVSVISFESERIGLQRTRYQLAYLFRYLINATVAGLECYPAQSSQ